MKLSTLGAVTAAIAISAVAGAQTSKPYEQIGVSFRAGVLFPTNKSTTDDIGTSLFAFGADYRLNARTPNVGSLKTHLSLSVDYYRRDDVGNIPVLINFVGETGNYFFQAGAGVGFSTLPAGDHTTFTYDVGVGYVLPVKATLPVFVQANFFGSDFSRVNGIGLYAGVRF